jgi:hypothetical protein
MTKRFFKTTPALLTGPLLLCLSLSAHSQFIDNDPDWKESAAPTPAALDMKRLVAFELTAISNFKWSIDPASIIITPESVVRYVVVAQSSSGAVNALYEGIYCKRQEVKTYAWHYASSGWAMQPQAEWRPLKNSGPSLHAFHLAKLGLCDGNAPISTPREAMLRLTSK